MFDIVTTVAAWLAEKRPTAIATVVETWGSAPRQAGAKMAAASATLMIGSVSGGCVEGAVLDEMAEALADQRPRLLSFGVSDDDAWDVGLACGGSLTVFVEPLDPGWWHLLQQHAESHLTTATVLSGPDAGAKVMLVNGVPLVPMPLAPDLLAALVDAMAGVNATARINAAGRDLFIEVFAPPPALIIIGGAHVALALNRIAAVLGFRVLIIDPRRAFATPERFPDVALLSHQYPDKALSGIPLNENTYVAVLTHDPKIDDPALGTVLPHHLPYVGILSSRRTHAKRVERLTAAGMDAALLAQVRTPIGLDIGARSPEEIALAIMAEIVAIKNKGGALKNNLSRE